MLQVLKGPCPDSFAHKFTHSEHQGQKGGTKLISFQARGAKIRMFSQGIDMLIGAIVP